MRLFYRTEKFNYMRSHKTLQMSHILNKNHVFDSLF